MLKEGLSLGAVDFVLKYSSNMAVSPDALRCEIIEKVKAAARVKVIRSIPSISTRFGKAPGPKSDIPNRIAVIGASTGGPLALKDLLTSLGMSEKFKKKPFPIVIVQHMPEGFTAILAAQLDRLFPFPVREAREGDVLSPGTVLIAPGDRHMLICSPGAVRITTAPAVNGQRPSIDVTMQSATQVFGLNTTGVILSGMGNDGSQGLLAIRNNCGHTFAQSKETCVIDSMPCSAIKRGVVERAGSPTDIGRWITESG